MTTTPLTLRRNFSWTMVGNLIYAFCLWGILSVLSKLGDAATIGRFALASAVASPAIMFAGLQLRSMMAADAGGRYELRDYISLRLLLLPPALLVVLLVAGHGYTTAQVHAIMLFGLARSVEMISDILYGVAQKHDRMDLVSRSKIIKGLASVAGTAGAYALTHSLDVALLAMAGAWLLPLLVYDLPRIRHLNRQLAGPSLAPRLAGRQLAGLAWSALPLGLVILLSQMRQTIPRTMLESSMGEQAVGTYAALAYVVLAGSTVVLALGQSTLARLARDFDEGNLAGFSRLGRKLVLLGVGIGAAGVIFAWFIGPFFLRVVYTREYAAHQTLFVLIMAGGGLLYVATLLAPLTTAMHAFRGQLLVQILQVGTLAALAAWLIPRSGLEGAAWSVIGATAVQVAGFAALVSLGVRQRRGRSIAWAAKLYQ